MRILSWTVLMLGLSVFSLGCEPAATDTDNGGETPAAESSEDGSHTHEDGEEHSHEGEGEGEAAEGEGAADPAPEAEGAADPAPEAEAAADPAEPEIPEVGLENPEN